MPRRQRVDDNVLAAFRSDQRAGAVAVHLIWLGVRWSAVANGQDEDRIAGFRGRID